MANTKTVKNIKTEVVVNNMNTNTVMNNQPKVLTVVVLDDKSNPTEGARVSIKPSDASNVTNGAGEVQFTLGGATKYDITASYGSKTVTVPYYVTKDGATRLVVNPTYVKSVEDRLNPSFFSFKVLSITGIVIGVLIAGFFVWRFFKRRKVNKKRE